MRKKPQDLFKRVAVQCLLLTVAICSNAQNTTSFLENAGIENAADIPSEFDAVQDTGRALTIGQRQALLDGVLPRHRIDASDNSVYLCAIRPVSDSIVIVQYGLFNSSMEAVYFATYSLDGTLRDTMYAGHNWNFGDAETIDDNTELIYATRKDCKFLSSNRFTLSIDSQQIEKSYTPEKETEKYRYVWESQYEITDDGTICLLSERTNQQGKFVGWEDQDEFDALIELNCLEMLPQSTPDLMKRYNDFGDKLSGCQSFEGYSDSVFEHVYSINPCRTLKYLYDNRGSDCEYLIGALSDIWGRSYWQETIKEDISRLEDSKARDYLQSLVNQWESDDD